MFCLSRQLRLFKPFNNCWRKGGGSESKVIVYLPPWQTFEKWGDHLLLLTILSLSQELHRNTGTAQTSQKMARHCEMLNRRNQNLSQVQWEKHYLLHAAGSSVSPSRELLVTTRLVPFRASACCCSLTLCTSCILSTFTTWCVLPPGLPFLLPVGSPTSIGVVYVLSVKSHSRTVDAILALLIAPCLLLLCIRLLHIASFDLWEFYRYSSAGSRMFRAWSFSFCRSLLVLTITFERKSIKYENLKSLNNETIPLQMEPLKYKISYYQTPVHKLMRASPINAALQKLVKLLLISTTRHLFMTACTNAKLVTS